MEVCCFSARSLARWITGAVGDGIADELQLDYRRACIDGGKDDVAPTGEVGIAEQQVT